MSRALLLTALCLASSGEARTKFRRALGNPRIRTASAVSPPPAPYFNLLTSNPSAQCDGASISSDEAVSITHTNAATTRFCTKADGTLASVTANQFRTSNNGILVEGSRTNLAVRSQEFNTAWTASNVTVTANSTAAPDGTTTADTLEGTASGGYVESTAFTPNQSTAALSLFVKTSSGTQAFTVVLRDVSAGVDRATTCDVTTATTTWQRAICSATSGITSTNSHRMRIYPGTDSGTGTIIAWGAQTEVPSPTTVTGSVTATSYIPTTAVSVNRPNDNYTWSNTTDISAQGCALATVTFGSYMGSQTVLSNGTAGGSEAFIYIVDHNRARINDGTNTVTATSGESSFKNRTVPLKAKWGGSSMSITVDGVTASGTYDGAFSSTATMHLGRINAGSNYCNCQIDIVKLGSHPNSCD